MKRVVYVVLALLMLTVVSLVLVACDSADAPADTTPTTDSITEEEATMPDTDPATTPETIPETETEPATEPETTPAPETETATPEAGMDHGIVRDGTPKKYFTLRFDDGITQDARVIEILKKHGVDCCTFYINTGLYGADWAWVGQQFNRPDVPHKRYTRKELEAGIYDGFDVEVHTRTHPSLKNLSDREVTNEVGGDAKNLQRIYGYIPIGMAWPGGDTEWNEQNIKTILETTNIRYGSCTTRTAAFDLPQYFMTWYPTCSFSDADVMSLADRFIAAEPTEDMLFYVWCHGYELDIYNTWEKFDQFIGMIAAAAAEDDSIVLVTNAEFYQLFKDEIPAWKE